jgi:N-acetylmuramoyl-L-alanine amidase
MGETHRVQQGECLSSIAKDYGFADWRTIYEHSENAAFREKRPDPNILCPDDLIYIPDKETREESRGTDAKHNFKRKTPKTLLRLALKNRIWQPLANKRYELVIHGAFHPGSTNGEGILEQEIPADLEEAELTVWMVQNLSEQSPDGQLYRWTLKIGHLDPIEEITGVQARLNNLGIPCGVVDGSQSSEATEAMRASIKAFRSRVDLGQSSTIDRATRLRLVEKHDKRA